MKNPDFNKILHAFYRDYETVLLVDLVTDETEVLFVGNEEDSAVQGNPAEALDMDQVRERLAQVPQYEGKIPYIEGESRTVEIRAVAYEHGFPSEALICLRRKSAQGQNTETENIEHSKGVKAEPESAQRAAYAADPQRAQRHLFEKNPSLLPGGRDNMAFLMSMSHDIRTPMNAIIGLTNIAASHLDEPEKVKDSLDKIQASSNHLLSLVNNVLEISRIESGHLSIHEKKTDLLKVMENVRDVIVPQTARKDQKLFINTDQLQTRYVLCDETRLTQLLLTLLNNAVNYSETGGRIVLSVSEKPSEISREYSAFEFRVRDNGIGISRDFQPRVFEPFERESTRKVGQIVGNGLGMSIARGIVEKMGGRIRLFSESGQGTEFMVDLAFRKAEPSVSSAWTEAEKDPAQERRWTPVVERDNMAIFVESEASRKGERAGEPGWIEGRRLLLVEDNVLNREIAQELLTEDGFKVDIAEDGAQALQTIRQSDVGHYAAVLMDISMPVMDGYEATRNIRSLPEKGHAQIPIIAMTANAFREDRTAAMDCGMNAYISKPVDVLTLRYVLRRVLD